MQTAPNPKDKTKENNALGGKSPGVTTSLAEAPKGIHHRGAEPEHEREQVLLLALDQVSRVLTAEVDIQKILEDMATIVAKVIGAKWVNFWNLTADKQAVYIVAHHGMKQEYLEHSQRHPIKLGTAWIGRAVQTGKAWGTSDILTDPKTRKEIPNWEQIIKQQDYRALLCVPLISGRATVGGLCAYFPDPHDFTDFEMRLMAVAANQAATAITNAKIFAELLVERNKTVAMLNSLYDGIMVFDLEQRMISFNPRAEELLWVRGKDVIGKGPGELDLATNPFLKNIQYLKTLPLVDFESKDIILEEPQRIHLRITALPVRDANNQKIGSMRVLHDITVEKETEELKSSFVSTASHQLRTPLSGLKWALDLMSHGDYGPVTPEQTDILARALQTADRLIDLVRDLLDISRIEEGRFGYTFSLQNLAELTQAVIQDLASEIAASGLRFTVVTPAVPLPKISADPNKLKMAIVNLIDNAFKYTLKGGTVTISFSVYESSIILNITDTGIGIPKEQQKFIFTKFFRAPNAIRLQTEGSGLGLWIANEIVKRHHGRIWFESEENKGSIFSMQLPIKPEEMPKGKVEGL